MADRATYILMATYIVLFTGLFVCVFGAMIVLVREQTTAERPAMTPVDARPPVRMSVATNDAGASDAPGAVMPPTPRIIPT